MAQGLEENKQPRVKQVDEKKISGISVRKNHVEGRAMGSRRIFAPHFKLKVLDSYREDSDCRGNQRATARKYGIHRRQIQKWLQVEASLRTSVSLGGIELSSLNLASSPSSQPAAAAEAARQLDDIRGGESQLRAPCQIGGAVQLGEEDEKLATAVIRDDDSGSDNQDSKHEVTVTLFPSVKIVQLEMKNENLNTLIDANQTFSGELLVKSYPLVRVDSPVSIEDVRVKEEDVSEDDEISSVPSEQPLDFTCAALSKRRSFSLYFKLEVLDAFHSDRQCHGNQRATARKFGINRRQVQKWLLQEADLRGETVCRGGLYRQRLVRWAESEGLKPVEENAVTVTNCALDLIKQSNDDCWDLSNRKRKSVPVNVIPFKKRMVEFLSKQENKDMPESVTSSVENRPMLGLPEIQETALCLVKAKRPPLVTEERSSSRNSVVSSSVDVNRVMGQALYHSNRDHYVPPYRPLPLPTHVPNCFSTEMAYHDLHQVLNMYQGFVGGAKVRENPLDLKLKALDRYHRDEFYRENQFAVASRFGVDQDQLDKWLRHEDQLRQYGGVPRLLNIFR